MVEPDGREVTYAELDGLADGFARFLDGRGLGPGRRVGVAMPKCVETVAAIHGVLRAGAAYVPVDVHGPAKRSHTILSDCAVDLLVVHGSRRDLVDGLADDISPDAVVVVPAADAVHGEVTWDQAVAERAVSGDGRITADPTDLAYVLYTSGSTGVPKGVPVTHAQASSFVEWASTTFEPTEEDRFSSHAPFHFDLSILDLYLPAKHGASLHLLDDGLSRNPRALAQLVAERDLTFWYSTPSALALLAQHGRLDRYEYEGPRVALFAGEVFPVKHLRAISELWPRATWFNLYGPTETNVCTFAPIPLPIAADRVEPYPIGTVCAHCTGVVLDPHGEVVEPGEAGELFVAGASVFDGYWNRPELDDSIFIERDGHRYYATGDIVVASDDGELRYRGRRDRMVKRRGYRIELGEVEKAVHPHASVRDVASVAVSDDTGVRITLFYTADDPAPSIVELKQFTAARLPHYMVPDVFEEVDALPLTSTGKTDYRALAERAGSR